MLDEYKANYYAVVGKIENEVAKVADNDTSQAAGQKKKSTSTISPYGGKQRKANKFKPWSQANHTAMMSLDDD